MRTITLSTDSGENKVPLFEIGDVLSSAIDGTLAVIEETEEIILYYSDRWNTVGRAQRLSSMLYREMGKDR